MATSTPRFLTTARYRYDAYDIQAKFASYSTFERIFNILVQNGEIPEADADEWKGKLRLRWHKIARNAAYKARVFADHYEDLETDPLVSELRITLRDLWERFYDGFLNNRERAPGGFLPRGRYINTRGALNTLGK